MSEKTKPLDPNKPPSVEGIITFTVTVGKDGMLTMVSNIRTPTGGPFVWRPGLVAELLDFLSEHTIERNFPAPGYNPHDLGAVWMNSDGSVTK
ncbi:MAG: hypothetical protein KGJ23_08790 [Euryarchaeota archaeon]|nr:hypothetical protein [Euryarchaeota archaeon]MDE1836700.1 hypothetical protein [Euryarchaeota archaeon]MDE1880271.1 hypothetical protein [Euryarchaeota archaeon]MDE2044670.1 hypothetical protein [Thermoplasmata archaeon]